jgi:ATP-dependent Clp protease ATP-binding subunit ClpA
MPKINVYLPDDLAEAVRDSGLPVSAICQRALEDAVRRITAIRQTALGELDADQLAAQLPSFTSRAVTVIALAINAARDAGAPNVGTGHLLRAMITEGENLALRVLRALEIEPAALSWAEKDEPGGGPGLRYSTPAASALEMLLAEATTLGHNYVGCEHLLIGLAAEPDGIAGRALREAGADAKSVRRTVSAALGGYAHLRATKPPAGPQELTSVVRQELRPLVQRIEAIEARLAVHGDPA